ncbi:MAG: glycosyltransferase [Ginsengibacter sp.]
MNNNVVIFIDTVAFKNKLQVQAINQFGMHAHFFAYQLNTKVDSFLFPKNSRERLSKNPFKQTFQVFKYLKKNSRTIHHLEVYPGSALSFLYVLAGKLFGIKSICAERGDLYYYCNKKYNIFTRFSMQFCYRYSDVVWYRELYMKPLLEKIGSKELFFLHNAVPVTMGNISEPAARNTDFLWLNRVIPERRSDWFIQVLQKEAFMQTKNILAGFLADSPYKNEQEYILTHKPATLSVKEFSSDTEHFFKDSRFFVMPAEFIFANNALLEAMSFGVIPLISDQQGSALIVENGISGFIFPHTFEGLEKAMERVLKMEEKDLEEISKAARQKIISDFSEEKYIIRIQDMYALIEK